MPERQHYDLTQIDPKFCKDSYREGQKEAIEFVLNSFNSGKNIVMLEAPTGSGKTAIGMTTARFMRNSYYITSNKHLQDQIIAEFGTEMVEVKGRNAYPCTIYDLHGERLKGIIPAHEISTAQHEKPDCGTGYCKQKGNSKCEHCFDKRFFPVGSLYSSCPYYERVERAMVHPKVLMNSSSYLYQLNMIGDRFGHRELLIVDEAHNLESDMLKFVSCTITDELLRRYRIIIPRFDHPLDYVDWILEQDVIGVLKTLKAQAVENQDVDLTTELTDLINKYAFFSKRVCDHPQEWICEFITKQVRGSTINSVTFKPVFVRGFIYDYIFKHVDKVLLMSATLLDVNLVTNALGLDRTQVAAKRMLHRFPVKNRPIYIQPVAKMTGGKDKMPMWIPKLIKGVEKIARKYPDVKGIIHTHNFAITNALLDHTAKDVQSRLICQTQFESKQQMIEYHSTQPNTIIVAPAMHEGVDLKDDLSRFQILTKVPYPNIYDDKQLAARVDMEPTYYTWLSALKLVQSVGRSVRSETDYADTYIIDEAIINFLQQAKSIIPQWFTESIIRVPADA